MGAPVREETAAAALASLVTALMTATAEAAAAVNIGDAARAARCMARAVVQSLQFLFQEMYVRTWVTVTVTVL